MVEETDVRLGELVWVADYAAAARERGLARAKEVAEANARAESKPCWMTRKQERAFHTKLEIESISQHPKASLSMLLLHTRLMI